MSDKNGTLANRDFFEFVKSIGESKSKQEEDQIITEEVVFLKKKISESNIPRKKIYKSKHKRYTGRSMGDVHSDLNLDDVPVPWRTCETESARFIAIT